MNLLRICSLSLLALTVAMMEEERITEDTLNVLEYLDSENEEGDIEVRGQSRTLQNFLQDATAREIFERFICEFNGLLHCAAAECEPKRFYFRELCCSCACPQNQAALSSTHCSESSWSSWSHWSKCIRTKWGGLQTRERVCKSKGKDAPGTCMGRGSESRTCSSVTEEFRIRKNLLHITDEEMHDLIQAMTKFKQDTSRKGYKNIISWHGYPGRCPWYHEIIAHTDNHCSWHHHPLFLPWHRLITVQLELGLQRYLKNKTFGIPFWDWTEHARDIPYLLRHPEIYDPVLKKYVHNPFYRSLIKKNHTGTYYTHRNIWYPGVLMDQYLLKGTVRALLSHDYFNFDDQLSDNPHDQIHNCFCYKTPYKHDSDWCEYGMPTVEYASWDPAFLLHHSAMDRIFVMRRRLEENAGLADWTKSRVIGQYLKGELGLNALNDVKDAFEWPLSPFCNKSMNPEPVTRKDDVWTLHKSYYDEQLFGYKYDNFDLGNGYSWEDLQSDFRRNNIDRKYRNDELLRSKLGPLAKKICPNKQMNENRCLMRC